LEVTIAPGAAPLADGLNKIHGGAGTDIYDASLATGSLIISIDAIQHSLAPVLLKTIENAILKF
jgi:hypothetical protein